MVMSQQVQEAFQDWDTRGQGTIGREQLTRIIRRLTPQVGDSDLEALFAAAGAENGAGVKYNDFLDWLWSDSPPSPDETRKEAARQRGLWEDALNDARARAAQTWPAEKVNKYWNEVQARLVADEYIQHVKTQMFTQADKDKDGRVSFDEAKALIIKSLKCSADLMNAPQPTQEEVRDAFDAHDTLVDGRGQMSMDEFVNLARYLQVRVAEAMLPLSKVVTD
mmetsp:Transcript_22290/g.40154  ORF Transcript_22290/g.40154 Transcript_22290/m.40154 type:complete len:222 (-) Transcript_22290:171-836(-)|eukprot:CAMPEP_0197660820 /NCGR_PEP_ID=MMETSP1338-20131121/51079_1 /TAXON_ID=43686 ORGANISM="Pelagodinium beii, Strain RCC1491" /NCGR_SAMPLE_ID=MMETSP1338 /ASSEMBLY_ACC=CAM_ASM_000754 /LENGTH=221 /DNA_ID=CAMNT_0043238251 /DNA_START=98 /DNA_END=763 /DNA_ORIENTATION=+